METFVVIKVTHKYPVEGLASKAANRAYTLAGVDDAEVVGSFPENPVKKSTAPTAGEQADAYDGWCGFAA